MNMLGGLLGQMGGKLDVAALAAQVGLSPEMAERAIGALAQAQPAPGDTVQTAAQHSGIAPDVLQQIVARLGGEGVLAQILPMIQGGGAGGLAGMLDRDGDGNPVNDVTGLIGGFLKR